MIPMDFEAHINADSDPRMKKGKELMDLLDPDANKVLYDSIGDINPDLADYVLKFAYGEIINRPQLSLEKRELATISALVAMGNARNQLKSHLKKALHIGIPKGELAELMLHLMVYAGFPAAINGTTALKEVLEESS